MVEKAKNWPWSSYRKTYGMKSSCDWITTEWLLSSFSKKLGMAQKLYGEYIDQGNNQSSLWESLQNQMFLGSEEFVAKMLSNIDEEKELSEIPKSQRKGKAKTLIWYKQKASNRNEAIKLAYDSGGYSMKDIGKYYKLHYSRVSRILKAAKDET